MDTARRPTDARKFVLLGSALSLGLFGLLRLPWTELQLVLPLTQMQGALAVRWFGAPVLPVQVTLACSGADALALCVAAVLAYPVRWRSRLAGAAGGIALILWLNTLRIGTLGLAVASPWWFDALHLYAWPLLLTLAIAAYVFGWVHFVERFESRSTGPGPAPPSRTSLQPSRRFIGLTLAFVILFAAAAPFHATSPLVLALGGVIAGAVAAMLGGIGVAAQASANMLTTSRGAFLVTEECISTPLIPVYLAAVCAYAPHRRWLAAGLLATVPLFTALGVARLLVVALPDALIASPLFFVHAFYQLLLGAVVVGAAAAWRHGGRAAATQAALGVVAGALFMSLAGPAYTHVVSSLAGGALDDPQGAIAFLPAFQAGLYLALCIAAFTASRWRRALTGFGLLALTQVGGLMALHALAASGIAAHVRDVRAWAVVGPVLIFAAVVGHVRPSR